MVALSSHDAESGKGNPRGGAEKAGEAAAETGSAPADAHGICLARSRDKDTEGEYKTDDGIKPLRKGWHLNPGATIPVKGYTYPKGYLFDFHEERVEDLDRLSTILSNAARDPRSAVLRGKPNVADGKTLRGKRRLLKPKLRKDGKIDEPTLREVPRRWLAVDVDGIECPSGTDPVNEPDAVVEHVTSLLPSCFEGVSCIWQMSASAGILKADDKGNPLPMRIYIRLWFWLSRPLGSNEAKDLLAGCPIDDSLYNAVQCHYIAAPSFSGMTDPVPLRWGLLRGLADVVEVPVIEACPKGAASRGDGTAPAGGPSIGYDARKKAIGDHPGGRGLHNPLLSAIGAYFARYGSTANGEWLRADLEDTVRAAVIDPVKHPANVVDDRIADIPRMIENIRQNQASEEQKRAENKAADEEGGDDDESEPAPSRNSVEGLPVIIYEAGETPAITDEAENAVIARHGDVFQRGGAIVRLGVIPMKTAHEGTVNTPSLLEVRHNRMAEYMATAACFKKWDGRAKEYRRIDPPAPVVATLLDRQGDWKFRVISALISAPTLRPDGSILETPGYDDATGLFYDPANVTFPPIPQTPTREDALAALDILKEPLRHFPWADLRDPERAGKPSTDFAVALSGILTAVARNAMDHAPMHALTAPTAGSGKSKVVSIASVIATGQENGVISQAQNPEEFEKRLGAALIAGHQIVSIDNCEHPLGGDVLCMAMTEPSISIRPLGFSKLIKVQTNTTFFATGNNLVIEGDMTRRALLGALDSGEERPALRQFDFDPVEMVKRDRPKYLVAALTILRAYVVAGSPGKLLPVGSFGKWSDLVRSALVWLGEADPWDSTERIRKDDPKTKAMSEVFQQWWADLKDQEVTTKALIDFATKGSYSPSAGRTEFENSDLRYVLLEIANDRGNISGRRLGTWLGKHQNKPVGGFMLGRRESNGSTYWRLVGVVKSSPQPSKKRSNLEGIFTYIDPWQPRYDESPPNTIH